MAYMSQEKKKSLAPAIKAVLKKYNIKGSIGVDHHSCLTVKIKSGVIDFGEDRFDVNYHWIHEHYKGVAKDFLTELKKAMMTGNHDNSDSMTDYFDVGWYIAIRVGQWDKPYIVTQ